MKQVKAEIVEEPIDLAELRVELAVVCGAESGLFTPTDVGLEISEDISFAQYTKILCVLKMAKHKAKLWLSDAITFGKRKFSEALVDRILEQLEFEMPDVRSAIAIEGVPSELRDPFLTSDHYVELSKGADRPTQIKWARIASDKHLTPSQLKFSMAEGEVVDRAATKLLNTGVVTPHGIRQSFDVWLRRMGGIEGVQKLDEEMQEDIAEELSAIIEFGIALDASLSK
jgi:hypothetical protein